MTTVSIKEAKDRLTALAGRVEGGETVVVTRNGKPVFDLVPHRTAALRLAGRLRSFSKVAASKKYFPMWQTISTRRLPRTFYSSRYRDRCGFCLIPRF